MSFYQGKMCFTGKVTRNVNPSYNDNTTITTRIPPGNYYRKALDSCNCVGNIQEIIHNVDCCKSDKEKIKYNANTKLSKSYYVTHDQYLKSKCKTFNQNYVNFDKTVGDKNGNGLTRPNCHSCFNTCSPKSYYKRSNDKYGTTGAVSSSSRILRLKYNNIKTTGKYNQYRPKYRGDTTQNLILTQTKPVYFRRNGTKTSCNC